jgi:hypothetical protein
MEKCPVRTEDISGIANQINRANPARIKIEDYVRVLVRIVLFDIERLFAEILSRHLVLPCDDLVRVLDLFIEELLEIGNILVAKVLVVTLVKPPIKGVFADPSLTLVAVEKNSAWKNPCDRRRRSERRKPRSYIARSAPRTEDDVQWRCR